MPAPPSPKSTGIPLTPRAPVATAEVTRVPVHVAPLAESSRLRFDCLQLAANLKRGMTTEAKDLLPLAEELARWCNKAG